VGTWGAILVCFDHETIVRWKGVIIGKVGETGAGDFGAGNERLTGAAWIYFGSGA